MRHQLVALQSSNTAGMHPHETTLRTRRTPATRSGKFPSRRDPVEAVGVTALAWPNDEHI